MKRQPNTGADYQSEMTIACGSIMAAAERDGKRISMCVLCQRGIPRFLSVGVGMPGDSGAEAMFEALRVFRYGDECVAVGSRDDIDQHLVVNMRSLFPDMYLGIDTVKRPVGKLLRVRPRGATVGAIGVVTCDRRLSAKYAAVGVKAFQAAIREKCRKR